MSDDVYVEVSVRVPCGGGSCSQSRMTKTILFNPGMIPLIGDQIRTENGMHTMRLQVVGRVWSHRQLTLLCKPSKMFSTQTLLDSGFERAERDV